MLVLHHLENSRSQRVLWLLEELGLAYELRRYRRDAKTLLAPPELAKVHPLGKSPVLTDGEATVAESGAIIEYLLDLDGSERLRPAAGSADRRRFTYWLHFAEGSAAPFLLLKLVFDRLATSPAPFFVRPLLRRIAAGVGASFILPNITRQLQFIESELAQRPWFAGERFSAADIQMSYAIETAAARLGLTPAYPHLADWLFRIHARAAYRRALQIGGPYDVLI